MTDIRRLPGPASDKWEWQLQGACRGVPSEVFFHPEGERGPSRVNREAAAKSICARCPVIDRCRAHALATREPYGVWGGLSESEREDLIALEKRTERYDEPHRRERFAQAGQIDGALQRAADCA